MFKRLLMARPTRFAAVLVASVFVSGGFTCYGWQADQKQPAQAADQTIDPGNSGLKISQRELIREFEAGSAQDYLIGAGDEIQLQVPGQADLQGHHVVGPDGKITLPLLGPVQISGLTREGAAQMIEKGWKQFYSVVSVSVQITKYGSNRIVVVGRVSTPGPIYFDNPPTLLEVLAKSGAYSQRPAETATEAKVVKTGAPAEMISRCAIYRGSEQVLWVDMKDLFSSGVGVDLHLRRNDVVFVPDEQESLVSVLGQVSHPGAIRLMQETRLIDLLAMAGGLTNDAASDKIQIVRPSTGMTRQIALKDLLNPAKAQTSEIALQRGDVVYVPKSGLGKMGYVLEKFSPAGSMMMFGAVAAGR